MIYEKLGRICHRPPTVSSSSYPLNLRFKPLLWLSMALIAFWYVTALLNANLQIEENYQIYTQADRDLSYNILKEITE